jgi:Flp pilus assembly protein TadG
MARWQQALRANDGSEIAEVAVILPIVLAILFAILWFGRAYNIYSTITYAAREGAQAAVVGTVPSCATCGAPPTPAVAAANAAARVNDVLKASHIDTSKMATYTPNPVPGAGNCAGGPNTNISGNVTVYSNVQLNPGSTGPPACGVVVSFQYPFSFFLLNPVPPYGGSALNLQLKAVAQMQGEN